MLGRFISKLIDLLLNGFWANLDVNHWRKTVLVLFILVGFCITGIAVVVFKQHTTVMAFDYSCVKKAELDIACNNLRAERKEMTHDILKSVNGLAANVKELQNSYIHSLEEQVRALKEKP